MKNFIANMPNIFKNVVSARGKEKSSNKHLFLIYSVSF